ncbi:MAG: DUF4252 domain-containing protein [Muribaculaceae bacterium]|nr:DUF4252 domain-containing protein [Muribaculaceae bacterium]
MMRTLLKTIAIIAILAMTGINANAQSTAVDKVAQLDDVYCFNMPEFMIKGIEKLGGNDILKATPIPTGILKKVKNIQFISTSKKKAVKKAQKILKDLDDTKKYQMIFRSSANKQEKVAIYAYPARSERFNEVVLLINEHDRQLTLFQLIGDFSMEDINDIEDELNDDKTQNDDEDLIIIDASKH